MKVGRIILASGIGLGIFGLLIASLLLPISGIQAQIEDVLLGGFIGAFSTVVGFYFHRS